MSRVSERKGLGEMLVALLDLAIYSYIGAKEH